MLAYATNRWFIAPRVGIPFLHHHFGDLLLVPAALPWVLWIQERTGLRTQAGIPRWSEILLHLAVWSVVCEFVAPRFAGIGVADVWDVLAYAVGAVVAGLLWNLPGHRSNREPS